MMMSYLLRYLSCFISANGATLTGHSATLSIPTYDSVNDLSHSPDVNTENNATVIANQNNNNIEEEHTYELEPDVSYNTLDTKVPPEENLFSESEHIYESGDKLPVSLMDGAHDRTYLSLAEVS